MGQLKSFVELRSFFHLYNRTNLEREACLDDQGYREVRQLAEQQEKFVFNTELFAFKKHARETRYLALKAMHKTESYTPSRNFIRINYSCK